MGTSVRELWLGASIVYFSLGTVAWKLQLGKLRLGLSAWEFSLRILFGISRLRKIGLGRLGTGSTDAVGAADGFMNHNGVTTAAATGSNSGAVVTISAANSKIKVGQYVLIVNDNDAENTGLTIDAETPIPIYEGDNKQGVQVIAYTSGATTVTLSADTTPTASQTLIFIDEVHYIQ